MSDRHDFYAFVAEYDDRLQVFLAELYTGLGSTVELSSRATFSLLSSLTLLGLALASSKPDSVQVLGFTIQASHWLYLAIPLSLVVLYAVAQLSVAWRVEWFRLKYVTLPWRRKLDQLMRDMQLRGNSEAAAFFEEQERVRDARNAIEAWHSAEQRRISNARHELLFDPDDYIDPNFREKLAVLKAEEVQLEAARQKKLDDAGIPRHDRIRDGILELVTAGKDSAQVVLATQYLANIKRTLAMRLWLVWLGLIIPLLVALFSILTLGYMMRLGPSQG